jgi:hypothetical protein
LGEILLGRNFADQAARLQVRRVLDKIHFRIQRGNNLVRVNVIIDIDPCRVGGSGGRLHGSGPPGDVPVSFLLIA